MAKAWNELAYECGNPECPYDRGQFTVPMQLVGNGLAVFPPVRCECSPDQECKLVTEG